MGGGGGGDLVSIEISIWTPTENVGAILENVGPSLKPRKKFGFL